MEKEAYVFGLWISVNAEKNLIEINSYDLVNVEHNINMYYLLFILHEVGISAVLSVAWGPGAPEPERHPRIHAGDDAEWRQVLNKHQDEPVTQHGAFR